MKTFSVLLLIAVIMCIVAAVSADKDKGVGPVKNLKLEALDQSMASQGRQIFYNKCATCHSLDDKKIGPPLRNVAKEQTPEYIMNLLLNTQEMQQKDERVKQLLATYKVPMINNQLSFDQARQVYEFLRYTSENKGAR